MNQAGETAMWPGVYEARQEREKLEARSLVDEVRAVEQGTDGERRCFPP